MEPENTPLEEENHLPNSKLSFSGSILIFGNQGIKDESMNVRSQGSWTRPSKRYFSRQGTQPCYGCFSKVENMGDLVGTNLVTLDSQRKLV